MKVDASGQPATLAAEGRGDVRARLDLGPSDEAGARRARAPRFSGRFENGRFRELTVPEHLDAAESSRAGGPPGSGLQDARGGLRARPLPGRRAFDRDGDLRERSRSGGRHASGAEGAARHAARARRDRRLFGRGGRSRPLPRRARRDRGPHALVERPRGTPGRGRGREGVVRARRRTGRASWAETGRALSSRSPRPCSSSSRASKLVLERLGPRVAERERPALREPRGGRRGEDAAGRTEGAGLLPARDDPVERDPAAAGRARERDRQRGGRRPHAPRGGSLRPSRGARDDDVRNLDDELRRHGHPPRAGPRDRVHGGAGRRRRRGPRAAPARRRHEGDLAARRPRPSRWRARRRPRWTGRETARRAPS